MTEEIVYEESAEMNFDQDIFQDMSGYDRGYKADYEGQNPMNYDNEYYQEVQNIYEDQNDAYERSQAR